jgi:hypothetical protein
MDLNVWLYFDNAFILNSLRVARVFENSSMLNAHPRRLATQNDINEKMRLSLRNIYPFVPRLRYGKRFKDDSSAASGSSRISRGSIAVASSAPARPITHTGPRCPARKAE